MFLIIPFSCADGSQSASVFIMKHYNIGQIYKILE